MKTSFELINDGLGVTVLTHETRIHTNRNESRPLRRQFSSAYRGTAARSLAPSQSARAKGGRNRTKNRADCEGASVPRLPAISQKRSRV